MNADGAWNTRRLSVAGKEALGARVRELAAAHGLPKQRELIRAAGVGNTSIEKLWNGVADPSLSTLLAVARALSLGSIEDLLAPLGTRVMLRYMTAPDEEQQAG